MQLLVSRLKKLVGENFGIGLQKGWEILPLYDVGFESTFACWILAAVCNFYHHFRKVESIYPFPFLPPRYSRTTTLSPCGSICNLVAMGINIENCFFSGLGACGLIFLLKMSSHSPTKLTKWVPKETKRKKTNHPSNTSQVPGRASISSKNV